MADTIAPRLTGIGLPASVDVRSSQSYIFAANATDDDSGVGRVELLFDKVVTPGSFNESRSLIFSDSTESFSDGTSLLTTGFSSRLGTGTYNVVGAIVTDKADNVATYDAAQIRALGGATSFELVSDAVIEPDLPVLRALSLPSTVSLQGQTFIATARATDATSGVAGIMVQFDRPFINLAGRTPSLTEFLTFNSDASRQNFQVGDDFTARRTFLLEGPFRYSQPGNYDIVKVVVLDRYGNTTSYDPAALQQLGIATRVTVTNDPVPPPLIDVTGPAVIRESDGSFALTLDAPYLSVRSGISVTVDASSTALNGTDVTVRSDTYFATNPQARGASDISAIGGIGIVNDNVAEAPEQLVLRVQVPGARFANGTDTKLVSISILDNDGNGGDVLWFQPGLRQFTTWLPDGAGFRYGSFTSAPLDAGVRPTGRYDFTGDGRADVLLQTAEGNVVSVMRATAAGGYEQFGMTGAMEAGWRIAGVGDVSGDARADILFRRGGELSIATSDGATLKMNAVVEASPSADWHIAAVDDFNGDGREDIYWRSENGTNALWYSTGTGFDRFGPQSSVDRGWHVEGSGDFNGDGRADLVWRNDNGAFVIWAAEQGGFNRNFYGNGVGTEWTLEQVQDFNGDGRADLLWRTGGSELSVWQWAGNTFSTYIDPKGPTAASWTLPPQTLDFL